MSLQKNWIKDWILRHRSKSPFQGSQGNGKHAEDGFLEKADQGPAQEAKNHSSKNFRIVEEIRQQRIVCEHAAE